MKQTACHTMRHSANTHCCYGNNKQWALIEMSNKTEEDCHKTTLIITIEQTVESSDKLPEFHETVRDNKRKRVYDAPKPSCFFHMEYQVLPGQPVYKTDVVTFGVVSKIYTDVDSRVVKTFQEGANISYGWKHTHSIKVTKNLLLDLYDHVFHLRIWDGKNKVSPRARFDQPKAFRLPASKKSDSDDECGARQNNFLRVAQEHSRELFAKSRAARMSRAIDLSNVSLLTSPSPQKLTDSDGQEGQSWSKLSVASRRSPTPVNSPAKPVKESPLVLKTEVSRLAERAREESERNGIVVLSLCMANLFANKKSLSVEITEPVQTLVNCRLTISLKSPLMSERLLRDLNPMTITVLSANNLPDFPVGYDELQEKCEPAYVSYQFIGHDETFRTTGEPQASNLAWEQSRVFLLGIIDKMILSEYLRGPPLQFELHDRDRKLIHNTQATMFGKEKEDSVLGTTSFVEGRCMKVNPFVDTWKPWDSYGIALCDMSGLLQGETFISSTVAVLAGPRGPEKSSGLLKPPTREVCEILPTGDYLQCGTELSIEIELTYPLTSYSIPASKGSCPFGRIVFILDYKHKNLVQELLSLINDINIKALELSDMPKDDALAILSTYKLKREQINSDSLDIVTGFHLMDGEVHVIVLEGLRHNGILHIWETIPRHPSQSSGVVEVLYNSEYAFNERLYGELDVEICCIRLHHPLHQLVQVPQPYLWNKMPLCVFQGLMCIHGLLQVTKLSDAARTNLFPSVAMIQELSMEFAVPALVEELEMKETKDSKSESSREPRSPTVAENSQVIGHHNRWTPLDNYNKQYEEHFQSKMSQAHTKNHIHDNILKTKALSEASSWKKTRGRSLSDDPRLSRMFKDLRVPQVVKEDDDSDRPVHNYSIQTFNSSVLAKKQMQKRLSQEPNARFTYSQQYHFQTVTPISVEKIAKQCDKFVCHPHNKTALDDNQHPKDPDIYRKADLKQPFEDNILHANKLKPTVDRMEFSWQRRDEDFELYRKPPLDFGSSPPITIHLAGGQRKKEIDQFRQKECEKWHSKVVVDQSSMVTHRLGVSTELSTRPSCSIDKLKGLLKDEPQKLSLKLPGLKLDDSPALCVVQAAEPRPDSNIPDDVGSGFNPGAMEDRSLKLDKNVIAIPDRNHDAFIKLKGQDFRLHYQTQQSITSQPMKFLNKTEPTTPQPTEDTTT